MNDPTDPVRIPAAGRLAPDRPAPFLLRGVRRLLTEIDRAVREQRLNARNPIADAALDLAGQVDYQMGTAEYDPSVIGLRRLIDEAADGRAEAPVPRNVFLVGSGRDEDSISVSLCGPSPVYIAKPDAVGLAAWVAVLADPMGDDFDAALRAVRNT